MPSNDNVYVASGFVEDGFYELVAAPPAGPPVVIDMGAPGEAEHLSPLRTLGGSVVDLDLLYGVLGSQEQQLDIQPLFGIVSRRGFVRVWAFEMVRQEILDAITEAYTTLIDIETITFEGNPAGANLFGFVGLASRPTSSVRIYDAGGVVRKMVMDELVMNSPAGLWMDINHQIVAPVLTGVLTGIRFEGATVTFTYGAQTRKTKAPNLND